MRSGKYSFMSVIFLVLITLFVSCNHDEINTSIKNQSIDTVKLDNPLSVSWIKQHLAKYSPRLILTPELENQLKAKLKTDPQVQAYYQYLKKDAEKILTEPLLERKLTGRRLLGVSREMVNRMGTLCMVYRIDREPEVLSRIDDELNAVCNFSDWHPAHFLDVAEMSFAVALAVDWVGEFLPDATVSLCKNALIEKGINPSFDEPMWWIKANNNWNEVCHGGMIAAALAIADVDPALAAKTIGRALDNLPYALVEYEPDGIYPEGPGYWGYGTGYAILASSMLTSALGTDFGISEYPSFMESARVILLLTAPSGDYFNFSDCGLKRGNSTSVLLSWFAAKTGDGLYFDKKFFDHPSGAGRLAGPGLVWLSQYQEKQTSTLPLAWYGEGPNPVVMFRGGESDPGHFYFAAKGGSASVNHSNMDAGTFIFELDGVRWVIDPGTQNYNDLEQAGFDLWHMCQDCQRWTLLTKSNKGHSTLTVDDARHNVKGYAPITGFKDGKKPEVIIDLTEIFKGHLKSALRKFVKESNRSLLVEDEVKLEDTTKIITWALMTTADVVKESDGALLEQDGKKLRLTILSPGGMQVTIVSLDPPPLALDKKIPNLKRVEINCPASAFPGKQGWIKVRLSGE